MRIAVATQEDPVYIPKLLALVLRERVDIVGVVILPGELSVRNTRKYLDLMGPKDFAGHALRHVGQRTLDLAFPSGHNGRFHSVKAVARRHGVPVFRPRNINDDDSRATLRTWGVDLLVSIAAPQIFRAELLALPGHGCINVHNGLLPQYQGMLPSFWVLANDEPYTGTTVHYMNERIDAGNIIVQERVPITAEDTVHSLFHRTKVDVAPRLLLQAISLIEEGRAEPIAVDWSAATYYSFPDKAAVTRFRRHGRRFR